MIFWLLLFVQAALTASPQSLGRCRDLGEPCSKTPWSRCCGSYVCLLESFWHGRCVECYERGQRCLRDRDCCTEYCHLFRCRRKEDSS
ncbi:unnamed protein product [Calicophoron daubneyi]|uniref:UPF0506 domain-containing protein n=1 Tax=Calicophoron daubneyi TaxID=300641 RepID=A0AAV2T5B4_CALDB